MNNLPALTDEEFATEVEDFMREHDIEVNKDNPTICCPKELYDESR